MHDPMVLLYDVRPIRLNIWHVEPDGHDSAEVCGHAPHGLQRLAWAAWHWRHLRLRFWPYLKVKRWLRDHCGECGRRFFWRDARHSYQSSDTVYHDYCMRLRRVRSDLDDLTATVTGNADWNARWRAQRRLHQLATKETAP